jgi:leucyl-tRNA synthetase
MLLAYTPGREIKRDEAVNAPGDEDEGDEPIEDWKVLKPEERATIPEDQWVWRWVKMSKSMGNVVTPDEMAEKFGADSLRVYGLSNAPFEETVQWKDIGIEATYRWVNRVWRIWTDLRPHYRPDWREASGGSQVSGDGESQASDIRSLRRKLHQTIRKVGEDIENFRFNTCVAALMEFVNELSQFRNALGGSAPSSEQALLISEILETLPLLLSPIAPHLADEFWERLGKEGFTFKQPWPPFDPEAAAEDAITIVVQVNGKLRDRLLVPVETPASEIEKLALASEKVVAELNGKQVRKVITVPGKLVNVVIG